MKILVVGLGSIGRRHIRNLKNIAPETEIGMWRQYSRESDLGELKPAISRVFFEEQEALAWEPVAALVTNPASRHVETSLCLAEEGVHLFVEKPLSNSLEGVGQLLTVCQKRSLVLMVGYSFRFYEPLQLVRQVLEEGHIGRPLYLRAEVGQYLPDWRPGRDYRKSVSARKELGGGVVLELSHELDYACWMLGEVGGVTAAINRLSNLELDVEDIAEITLQFTCGAIGSIHLDMVQRAPVRSCRIAGTEGVLTWEMNGHQVRLFTAGTGEWEELHTYSQFDFNQVYTAELRHFLACVQGDSYPPVGGKQGRRVLEVALAAKRAAQEGQVVHL